MRDGSGRRGGSDLRALEAREDLAAAWLELIREARFVDCPSVSRSACFRRRHSVSTF